MATAYELTRLAFADVVRYRQILDELQAEEKYRRMSYERAREVIGDYHRSDGDERILQRAIRALKRDAGNADDANSAISPRNNAEVLTAYLDAFARPFRPADGELPPEFESFELSIGGVSVTGKPHLSVINSRGTRKYLYILTSKEWTDPQKRFFVGMLGEIVSANVKGATPEDVEGLDCRGRKRIRSSGLGVRNRKRAEFLVETLQRFGLE